LTTTAQLKREIEILRNAFIPFKPKTETKIIPKEALTPTQWQTLLDAEEILTTHELNDTDKINQYTLTEKETILNAYHLTANYGATT
jgi:hypothetical protein